MLIHTECFNPFQTNCYFLVDEDTGSTVVIDPGCYYRRERERLKRLVARNGWHIEHVLATHMHIDHVFGAAFFATTYGCPLQGSVADNFWADRAETRCRELGLELRSEIPHITHPLEHGSTVTFGNQSLAVIAVPGHSPGSLAYYHAAGNHLFAGDTLFKDSIGRTDLDGGNEQQLLNAIKEQIFTLPSDTIVYPGHGNATTVGREMLCNVFFK